MKGEKEQPDFIAEAFKMKIISAFPPANEQMIIHVLSLIYYRHERFISFRLCNNNPPGISILKINYITILAAPNKQKYICKNNHGYYNRYYFYKRLNVNNIWISLAEKKN